MSKTTKEIKWYVISSDTGEIYIASTRASMKPGYKIDPHSYFTRSLTGKGEKLTVLARLTETQGALLAALEGLDAFYDGNNNSNVELCGIIESVISFLVNQKVKKNRLMCQI